MINKIRNSIFLKSTIILLVGGTFSKIIGFILKIIVTRNLGVEGMGIYSLMSPTMSILAVLSTMSLPTAISKVVSEKSVSIKNMLFSLIPFTLIINAIIILVMYFFSPILSETLLKESSLYYPLIILSLSCPFVTISSIIKGYFWGKQNMFPYMLSNFLEQVTRLILIGLLINKIIYKGISFTICYIIIVNMIGEVVSQLVMINYFPKNSIKSKTKFDIESIKKVMQISIPNTTSKIVGSISYFLEPIILTNILLYIGYTKEYIVYEYGVINGYVLSLLLCPQFFIQNMSTSLVPELSKLYSICDFKGCIKRIKQIVFISLLLGLIGTSLILIFPKFLMETLYHQVVGIDYIKILSPFVVLFYIEGPLSNALYALNKSKEAMKCTIISSIIRLISIVLFSFLHIGMYSYIFSIIVNLVVSTYMYYKILKKVLT